MAKNAEMMPQSDTNFTWLIAGLIGKCYWSNPTPFFGTVGTKEGVVDINHTKPLTPVF